MSTKNLISLRNVMENRKIDRFFCEMAWLVKGLIAK